MGQIAVFVIKILSLILMTIIFAKNVKILIKIPDQTEIKLVFAKNSMLKIVQGFVNYAKR